MDKLKINVDVAGRSYPLQVDAPQQAVLQKAADKIEQMTKMFEANYAVRDKQDILAMCALQLAAQLEQQPPQAAAPAVDLVALRSLADDLKAFLQHNGRSL